MKNLFLAILEVIVVWVALGLFTNKWDGNRRIAMVLGIILGFNICKPTKDEAS